MSLRKNIVLCGFMGSGKTTVGRLLADGLAAPFFDLDDYIEDNEGMSIAELFRKYAEQGFRDCEHRAVLEVSRLRGAVIATGGGTLMFSRNSVPLQSAGKIVFLDAGFDECYRRIAGSRRPLVKSSTVEQLLLLHNVRRDCYLALADHVIRAAGTPSEVASAIVEQLQIKQ